MQQLELPNGKLTERIRAFSGVVSGKRARFLFAVCIFAWLCFGNAGEQYERVRADVAAGRGARAVTELRAVCARQEGFAREVTNGYQAGFFWWKLLGEAYRAEKPDEFGPWAYRALANASAAQCSAFSCQTWVVALASATRTHIRKGPRCTLMNIDDARGVAACGGPGKIRFLLKMAGGLFFFLV